MNDANVPEAPDAVDVYVAIHEPGGTITEPSRSIKKPGICGTVVIAPVRPAPNSSRSDGEVVVAAEYVRPTVEFGAPKKLFLVCVLVVVRPESTAVD